MSCPPQISSLFSIFQLFLPVFPLCTIGIESIPSSPRYPFSPSLSGKTPCVFCPSPPSAYFYVPLRHIFFASTPKFKNILLDFNYSFLRRLLPSPPPTFFMSSSSSRECGRLFLPKVFPAHSVIRLRNPLFFKEVFLLSPFSGGCASSSDISFSVFHFLFLASIRPLRVLASPPPPFFH